MELNANYSLFDCHLMQNISPFTSVVCSEQEEKSVSFFSYWI